MASCYLHGALIPIFALACSSTPRAPEPPHAFLAVPGESAAPASSEVAVIVRPEGESCPAMPPIPNGALAPHGTGAPCLGIAGIRACTTASTDVTHVAGLDLAMTAGVTAAAVAINGPKCAGARVTLFEADLTSKTTTGCLGHPLSQPHASLVAAGGSFWLAVEGTVLGRRAARIFAIDTGGRVRTVASVPGRVRLFAGLAAPLAVWRDGGRVFAAEVAVDMLSRARALDDVFDGELVGGFAGDRYVLIGRSRNNATQDLALVAFPVDSSGASIDPPSAFDRGYVLSEADAHGGRVFVTYESADEALAKRLGGPPMVVLPLDIRGGAAGPPVPMVPRRLTDTIHVVVGSDVGSGFGALTLMAVERGILVGRVRGSHAKLELLAPHLAKTALTALAAEGADAVAAWIPLESSPALRLAKLAR